MKHGKILGQNIDKFLDFILPLLNLEKKLKLVQEAK